MVKPKKISELKGINSSSNLKKYLHQNPNILREFVNRNLDFDDMGFDISSGNVCCPFCKDTEFHGQVNYNNATGMHNIYCYKCSELKNKGHAYTTWDYLTQIYRIEKGGLSFLDAVISLYNSFDEFKKAFEGHKVEINKKINNPTKDEQQEFIDNVFKDCNGDVLAFINSLYDKSSLYEINSYINLYNNIEYTVANTEWDSTDQNVQIFSKSSVPVKVVTLAEFDKFVTSNGDNIFIKNLFNLGTEFLYMIPTVAPNGKIVQITFRIGNGNTSKHKPKVKKVKATFGDINIPVMFGFHSFSEFKQGMPIVLVEGEKDAIALQTIYPYVLAMGRNTLGQNIKYLKYLTNKFIIIPDNDEAGAKGYERIKEEMNIYGLKLKQISINNPNLKDVADIYTNGNWKSLEEYMSKLKIKLRIQT